MNKTKTFKNLFIAIFTVSLIWFIIVLSTYIVCFFNTDKLYNLMVKYNVVNFLPFKISDIDLKKIATELINYISGKTIFLDTKISIDGILTDFYSVRTKIHMADVRNIFQNMLFSSYIAIIMCIISGFKLINKNIESIKEIKNTYIRAMILFVSIIAIFVIIASINFDSFFTKFHEVLFTNDFWLLDPNVDYIICLLPEKIFMIYGIQIVILTTVLLSLLYLFLHLLSKIQLHQEAR